MEVRSDISFFTSWSWIGTWLSSLPEDVHPKLLRAVVNGRVMGLGILVPAIVRKAKCIPVRVWCLHETGNPILDNLTIEYNGFVVDDTVKHVIEPMMLNYLIKHAGRDELQFNALRRPIPRIHQTATDSRAKYIEFRNPAFQVCLRDVRNQGTHVQTIKHNTRHQIKRSLKAYSAADPIRFEIAETSADAFAHLARLKHFHRTYWDKKPQKGAFRDDYFNNFHDRLIQNCFDRNEIQIVAIKSGEREIAYLYNFVWNGHVYNYQSGVNYTEMGGKYSPGLVAHSLAIDFNAKLGFHTYDFMAGDHRYKRSLTHQTVMMTWCAAQRSTLPIRAQNGIKKTAQMFLDATPLANYVPDWVVAGTPLALDILELAPLK